MGALVAALKDRLPHSAIHLGHALTALEDRGACIALQFRHNDGMLVIEARRAVLALPPRLLAEHVSFTPELDTPLHQAMRGTHTWMADQAKAVTSYARAFWREGGHSGNAFVNHAQAVLAEVFDACDAEAQHAALGGFVAMPAELRESYCMGMGMLVESQLAQLFGKNAEGGELHYQDWAAEAYTCSALDHTPPDGHPVYGNRHLRDAHWNGKLLLGGAETATHAGGYLEGALEAAARLARLLAAGAAISAIHADNTASLTRFGVWVSAQRSHALDRYRGHLNRAMASQYKQQLTQRALLDTVEQMYGEALLQLDALPLDMHEVVVDKGCSALTPELLAPFNGMIQDLVEAAVKFNRGSCAISNFPDEHGPGKDYQEAIRRDLFAAWCEFAFSVNDSLLARQR